MPLHLFQCCNNFTILMQSAGPSLTSANIQGSLISNVNNTPNSWNVIFLKVSVLCSKKPQTLIINSSLCIPCKPFYQNCTFENHILHLSLSQQQSVHSWSLDLSAAFNSVDHYSMPHCKRCTRYGNSVHPSVHPSVRPSHAGIVSKRRHIARCSLHCQIAKCV